MLSKHFAVLGTTGVGKSSAVALIAAADLARAARPAHSHSRRAQRIRPLLRRARAGAQPEQFKLPFWLFNFEEIVDVFFGGRPGLEEEVDFLSEVIPLAKSSYAQQHRSTEPAGVKTGDAGASAIRSMCRCPIASPICSRCSTTRMGKLENRCLAHDLSQADDAHRDGLQRSALCLHVRERQCRRRHDGGNSRRRCSGCRRTASR